MRTERREKKQHIIESEVFRLGNSLSVQWLGLHASTAKGASLVPGWGTKILNATGPKKEERKKERKIMFGQKLIGMGQPPAGSGRAPHPQELEKVYRKSVETKEGVDWWTAVFSSQAPHVHLREPFPAGAPLLPSGRGGSPG